jgi:hypothetical protein
MEGKHPKIFRLKLNKMMDSKGMDSEGMDSEGMEGKLPKIFGSNSKVSNPKVNPISSECIPSENIRFKIGIFIDWKVAYKPPEGVGRLRRDWVDLGR